ncbi:hypothetical protein [Xenorhabdus thuongxuanensis]|uniref:Acyl carrier protein n=1 Tax=Xenorhabdus thuongxuanensis TaxID=1873484 RepID=A0A1Q5TWR0_9GAMM|nr:hypothetical protein [Xenorhabdus thuongxuanensis]OKP04684.1 hypothetical protein Xentx_02605 [Xenorhabdus thuongxuanensis]
MNTKRIIGLLAAVGLPDDLLKSAGNDWRLRDDLGLNSAETLHLQILLEDLRCTGFSLWDTHDHSLEELEQLIDTVPEVPTLGNVPTINNSETYNG